MLLHFFGHATVGITAHQTPWRDYKLLFDPYEPGGFGGQINYPPIHDSPNTILVTHQHLDHCYTKPWPKVPVLGPESFASTAPIPLAELLSLRTLEVDHDAFHGRTRSGQSWCLSVVIDGLRIAHVGDIGELPSPEKLRAFTGGFALDILLLTCGGWFTLGGTEAAELARRLGAKLIVPIHYKTPLCTLPNLERVEAVTRHFQKVVHHGAPSISLHRHQMPPEGTVLVLDPVPTQS